MTETKVKERGILMHARAVNGILAGRKTQTRRIVKPQPFDDPHGHGVQWWGGKKLVKAGYGADYVHTSPEQVERIIAEFCPYGQPGDRLWVRETWGIHADIEHDILQEDAHGEGPGLAGLNDRSAVIYRADGDELAHVNRWRPSIHMPRWASRITLKITDVRVERVQDISVDDIKAEGVTIPTDEDGNILIDIMGVVPHLPKRERKEGESPLARWTAEEIVRAHWAALWDDTNGKGAWERNDWVWVVEFKVVSP